MEYRKGLLFILIITEICLSLFSVYEASTGFTACFSGFDCKSVQTSPYSSIFGIKLGWLGVTSFTALLLVYLLAYKNKIYPSIFMLSTIVGLVGAFYFISIQTFILNTFCSSCLLIDGLMILIFAISCYDYYKTLEA